jgi:hypothetical protein
MPLCAVDGAFWQHLFAKMGLFGIEALLAKYAWGSFGRT